MQGEYGKEVLSILLKIPTLKNFSFQQFNFNLPFLFLYQLHYVLRKNISVNFEEILLQNFKNLPIEGFPLLIDALPPSLNPQLATEVLSFLSTTPFISRFLQIIGDQSTTLSDQILSKILKIPEFSKTKLCAAQPFKTLWSILSSWDPELVAQIISNLIIPPDFSQVILDFFIPYLDRNNKYILKVFKAYSDDRIKQYLLDFYIKPTTPLPVYHSEGFELAQEYAKADHLFLEEINRVIKENMPHLEKWNFEPDCVLKSFRSGLNNLGSTCYINAVVQQLASFEEFTDQVISTHYDRPEDRAFQSLIQKLLFSDRSFIEMLPFTQEWKNFDGEPINVRQQQDATEFLSLLFTRINASLFRGKTKTKYIIDGNEIKSTEDIFYEIPFEVEDQSCLSESMQLSSAPETIEGYNYNGTPKTLQRFTRISGTPTILIIQLKRFTFHIQSGRRTKIDSRYIVDTTIDISSISEKEARYNLKGIIIHQGDADAGHYYSYVKTKDGWLMFNDVKCSIETEEDVLSIASGSQQYGTSAYLLFYEKVDYHYQPLPLTVSDEIGDDNKRMIYEVLYFFKRILSVCGQSRK